VSKLAIPFKPLDAAPEISPDQLAEASDLVVGPAGTTDTAAIPAERRRAVPAERRRAVPRSHMVRLNLEIPAYVMQSLKEKALRDHCSVRSVVMRAMRTARLGVHEVDIVDDARRTKKKPKT
jgi:hypothetical protein